MEDSLLHPVYHMKDVGDADEFLDVNIQRQAELFVYCI